MLNLLNQYTLAILFLISLFLFSFELDSSILPAHDTMLVFQYFDFIYSHYYRFGEIPRWLSNSGYGMPAFLYQLSFLNINKYLMILFGASFDIQNTLLLYKISLFLDRIIFVFGAYLLSTRLYQSRLSRWYLCLAALACVSLYYQPFFNFYLFYLFPILIYLGLSFLKTGKVEYFIATFFVGSLHFLGHTIYFIPLQFYVLIFIFLLYAAFFSVKPLSFKKSTPILFLLVMAFASCLIYLVYQSIEGVTSIADARDENFNVSLDNFLIYARLNVTHLIQGYLIGSLFQQDNTYYIGLLPLFLLLIGVFRAKSPQFWIFLFVALFVLSFSVGGVFSTVYYDLPGLGKYRHIGLVFGIFSLLLIIASGFVIEEILNKKNKPIKVWFKILSLIFFVLIIFDILSVHEIPSFHQLTQIYSLFITVFLVKLIILIVLAVLYWRIQFFQKIYIFAIFFVFEAAIYQYMVIQNIPQAHIDTTNFVTVKQHEFSKPRYDHTMPSQDESVQMINNFIGFIRSYRSTIYDLTFDWAGIASCIPVVRTDRWNPYMLAAVRARGGVVKPSSDELFFRQDDVGFKRSLGCMSPKFYFARSYTVASLDEADDFSRIQDPSKEILLSKVPKILQNKTLLAQNASFKLIYHSAHEIKLEVDVPGDKPALLLHADAWDARWSAMVNDQVAPVIKANIGIKAIALAPGKNDVRLEFAKNYSMAIFNEYILWLALLLAILLALLFYFEYAKINRYEIASERRGTNS